MIRIKPAKSSLRIGSLLYMALLCLSLLPLTPCQAAGPTQKSAFSPHRIEQPGKTGSKALHQPRNIGPSPRQASANPLIDPAELQPLTVYERQHRTVERKSGEILARLLTSLAGVLALFAGFARWLLPRLMERYPAFFEALRWREPPAEKSEEAGSKTGALSSSFRKTNLRTEDSPPPRLQVLTSTPLGADRELHLVDVSGRRLLIAAGPMAITVLEDMTERPWPGSPVDETARQGAPAWRLTGSRGEKPSAFDSPSEPGPEVIVLPDYDDQFYR